MKWFGVNSLIIYPLHLYGCYDVGAFLVNLISNGNVSWVVKFVIDFSMALIVSFVGVIIANRFFPRLAGRWKKK
jgi:hypothetical protein